MATKWTGKRGTYAGRPVVVIWVKGGQMIVRYTDTRADELIGEREVIHKTELILTEIVDVAPAARELEV